MCSLCRAEFVAVNPEARLPFPKTKLVGLTFTCGTSQLILSDIGKPPHETRSKHKHVPNLTY